MRSDDTEGLMDVAVTGAGPGDDGGIPQYLDRLGIPGLADIHVHFLPGRLMDRVWAYFDRAEEHYGRPWPIRYRISEQARVARLREFGLKAIPALSYAHKAGMAESLNAWSQEFTASGVKLTEPPNKDLGFLNMTVTDPDGNQLRFMEPSGPA